MVHKLVQTKTVCVKESHDLSPTINTLVVLLVILMCVMSLASTASDVKDSDSNKESVTPKSSEDKYRLGKSLFTGNPGQTQLERAYHWLSQAATEGHAAAQYELAMMIARGQTSNKNPDVIKDWLNRAADQGYADAMWALAKQYESATNVRRNRLYSYVWYLLSKEYGKPNASTTVKRALKKLNPGEQGDAQLIYLKKKRQLDNIELTQ